MAKKFLLLLSVLIIGGQFNCHANETEKSHFTFFSTFDDLQNPLSSLKTPAFNAYLDYIGKNWNNFDAEAQIEKSDSETIFEEKLTIQRELRRLRHILEAKNSIEKEKQVEISLILYAETIKKRSFSSLYPFLKKRTPKESSSFPSQPTSTYTE